MQLSIVGRLDLEKCLGMLAHGANLRRFLPDYDMAAVGTLPNGLPIAGEYQAVFHVGEQLAVTLLMLLLNLTHLVKEIGDVIETFFPRILGERGVHVGPFIILTVGSVFQILCRAADAVEQLEPNLGMLLLVLGRLQKQLGDLLVPVLLRLGGEVGVLVAGLRLTGKCRSNEGL